MKPKRPPSKIKKFLTAHIEKVGLGIGALLALMIIISGFRSRQGIEPTKTPQALDQEVTRTTSHIESFKWEQHFQKDRAVGTDLLTRAGETLRQIEADEYALDQYIKPPYHAPRKMRTEPIFYGATDLEARAGWGILARGNRSGRNSGPWNPNRQQEVEKGRPWPPSGARMVGDGGRGATENAQGTHFVAVTGIVPYRSQLKDYYDRFKNADGFHPERDFPKYLDWTLERAEVRPGAEPKWQKVADAGKQRNESRRWERNTMRDDFIDPQADLGILTSNVPPVTGSSLAEIARHSKIPTYQEAMRRTRTMMGMDDNGAEGIEMRGGPGEQRPDMRLPAGAGDANRGRGMGDAGRGRGGMGGDAGRGRFPREGGGYGEFQQGGSMGGQTFTDDFKPEQYAEHVMFRYFDFDVEVGKTYQYRLRLTMEDPNTPNNEQWEPEPSSLSEEVLVKKAESETRIYRRDTDFSPPSPPVTVYPGQRMVLGTVTPARETNVAGSNVSYARAASPAKAEAIIVEFDAERVAELPLKIDVVPGSVGYAVGKVEPLYQWKGWLGEPESNKLVRVNSVVLDIQGGQTITPKNKGDLTTPGSMLVWDAAKRKLTVLSELRDSEEFPFLVVPPESAMERGGYMERGAGDAGRGDVRRPRRGDAPGMEGGTGDAGRGGDLRGGAPTPRRRPG